jgi:hypothetical protein
MTTPTTVTVEVPMGGLGHARVLINPFAANALVDGFASKNPDLVKAALADSPAPEMFSTGALPPFTASGVDPANLMLLTWACRHYAAVAEEPAAVLQLIEQSVGDPYASADCEGLSDYMARVARWLSGPVNANPFAQRTTEQVEAADDVYSSLFGDQESLVQTANAERRVAEQARFDAKNRTGQFADGFGRSTR